jgi:hypothetical protein
MSGLRAVNRYGFIANTASSAFFLPALVASAVDGSLRWKRSPHPLFVRHSLKRFEFPLEAAEFGGTSAAALHEEGSRPQEHDGDARVVARLLVLHA